MTNQKEHAVFLTVKEAARALGVHESTLTYRMRKKGWTLQQAVEDGASKRPRMKSGDRYGHMSVVEVLPSLRGGNARVIARCDCGGMKEVLALSLKSGGTIACGGCELGKELHGQSTTRTYSSWRGMKDRCRNPNRPDFRYYGGRGISVCPEWDRSFSAFLRDMKECPDGATIDRIDVNGNYEPGNCRWATRAEQVANRRPFGRRKGG